MKYATKLDCMTIGSFAYNGNPLKQSLVERGKPGGGTWFMNIREGAAGESEKLPCPGVKFLKMIPCPGVKFS